jgi:hypothetical protein
LDKTDCASSSRSFLFCLPLEVLEGTIGVDTGTGVFGRFPVVRIFQQGRVKGPQEAGRRFDRVYQTLLFFVKEDAVLVFSGFDGKAAVFFIAEPGDKRGRVYAQEIGDFLYFVLLDHDSTFAVTAGSAFFAFKG